MHRLLFPATFVGHGSFPGRLYDVGTYPAAVGSDDPAERVHGEVYLLHDPARTLPRLDAYEGCTADDPIPHEYACGILDILMNGGGILPAHVYLYNRPVADFTPVPEGDYLRWQARRRDFLSPPAGT